MKRRLFLKRRTKPGAAPGLLIVDPTAAATGITAIAYGPDRLEEIPACPSARVANLRGSRAVLWVDIAGLADHAAISEVATAFGVHPLAVEDAVNTHQRPKAESYDGHVFVVFRMLTAESGAEGEQVAMAVGRDFVLTFQERPGDCFEPVRERLRHGKGRVRQLGPDYLGYALIDAAVDSYFPYLETLGEEIEDLEDMVVKDPEPGHVERVHRVKRDLLSLRRAVWPMREMLNALLRDEHEEISATTRTYLRDAYDHAIQLMDMVETYREIATSLLDVYLSSQSARMNEIMKVLTIISTIFIPLGFIASLYGMNFDTSSPWNMPELAWRFGYPAVLGLMAAIAFGLLWSFFRRGWLGGDRD
ncbi:MAG: magnesium/cobalt transporter CorA [Geminicoccaceae bacterium]|jgi:magnesium transporter|nr:magnesium/cobalt transporter CorA [Geminicoccaceae bacterium]